MKRTILLALVLACGTAQAVQPTPKWILYAYAEIQKAGEFEFFDIAGLKRKPAGHVEVWTKGVSRSALERFINNPSPPKPGTDPSYDGIVSTVAKRLRNRDELLYESVSTAPVTPDDRLAYMTFEALADAATIQPVNSMLWELDCDNDMARTLEISFFKANGDVDSSHGPGAWVHTSPESNNARLAALVCKVSS